MTPEGDVFSALANPVRRQILTRLRRGPLGVSELARGFEIGRPAVSEHLQVLRKASLVREEPRGRERYYHLDLRPLSEVEDWIRVAQSLLEEAPGRPGRPAQRRRQRMTWATMGADFSAHETAKIHTCCDGGTQ